MISYKDEGSHILLNILFKDRTGVLWIQTDAQGVVLLNTQSGSFHKVNLGTIKRFVGGSKTLVHYNYDSKTFYEFSTATNSNNPFASFGSKSLNVHLCEYEYVDHHGNFWYDANGKSLCCYHPKTKTESKFDFDLHLYSGVLFEDKFNKLWIAHFGKDNDNHFYLAQFDSSHNQIIKQYIFPFIGPDKATFVYATCTDDNNQFWFATYAGLFNFNPQQTDSVKAWKLWKHIDKDNTSLASDNLLSLCPDPKEPQKYLWLGTRGYGIVRFEIATGKCINFTDKDGLPNNVAYMMLPDEFGNLWISTNMGLSCFTPPGKTNGKGTFRNFTEEDGLAGNEFNTFCGKKLATGELFFQGVKGTTWFRPADVLKKQPAVPVHFISLSVNNVPVDCKTDSTIINGNISYCKSVKLTHEQNIFSIGFAAMDFRKKSGIHYRYYLEGFDKRWIEAGNKNEATYTNLYPGTYTFHATACNSNGVWNEKGTSIFVIIIPAWYQTWWFRLLVGATLAVALYAFYRYRLRQALKLQKLRNRIASDLHDEIGSTLSSISMFGAVARKHINTKPAEADVLLEQINDSTTEMMESMNDIVWTINTGNDKLSNVVNRMRAFAVQVLESKDILLTMQVDESFNNLKLGMVQRKNVYLIFKEAVNNSAKYSECKNVWIDISVKHNMLIMKIKDDGKGFSTDKPAEGKFGGNGIHNMKKRATESGGQVEIISNVGKGTSVEMHLKI